MAARRCGICGINWPVRDDFKACPVCDEETAYFSNIDPSRDWEERQAEGSALPKATGDTKTIEYRLERLRARGIDLDVAMPLAANRTIDLHDFEKEVERLAARGCDPTTAARILAP